MRAFVWIAVLGLALTACEERENRDAESKTVSATPEYTLDAETLGREYVENEVRADLRYKGKVVRVVGMCGNIEKIGFDDTPSFTLHTPKGAADIGCQFSKNQEHVLADLKAWEIVAVRGVCQGKIFATVILRGCVLENTADKDNK